MELINGRYELRKEIRRGGFGVTWYAWDTNLDMPVAVKEFSDPDPEHRRKFMREARTLAKFSGSRGIVNVRDFLEADGKAYMVMEYLDGEDLSAYVDQKGRLSLKETMTLLKPVMNVLSGLHAVGVLHRDVSPDNIRITGEGEVKLLDFGSVANLTNETLTRTVTVKPGYAPIEQYSGAAEQGPRTDLYSLCATIYKCITGRKPVDSLVRSFRDELARPSELGVKIRPEEEAVLMKGLSVKPDERYDSIAAFEEAMDLASGGSPKLTQKRGASELAGAAFMDKTETAPASDEPAAKGAKSLAERAFSDEKEPGEQEKTLELKEEPAIESVPEKVWEKPAQKMPSAQRGQEAQREQATVREPVRQASPGEAGNKRAGKKKGKGKFLIPLLLAGALIIAAVIFGTGGGDTPIIPAGTPSGVDYKSGDAYVTFRDRTITDTEINFVEKTEEIYMVTFNECQISDEMMKSIAGWTHVKSLRFDQCGGYSSLDPLAAVPALEKMELWEALDGALAGDELITTDFPETMSGLTIYCDHIDGTTNFMNHFPGLTSLSFSVKEDGCDISFLDNMPKLQYLNIYNQTIDEAECSHLYGHPDLNTVRISEGSLASLGWAEECANIYTIEAEDSLITDLSPLADHEKLTFLMISGAPVSDLTPLTNCKELYELKVDRSKVTSLAGLEGHEKLSSLNIANCQVSDLSPVSDANLTSLNASDNKITTLKPLSGCTNLTTLNVNRNELRDLDGCQDLIKLTYVRAAANHISDISGIKNCSVIKQLQLSKNEISDISALSNDFLDLEILDISDNKIFDISALSGCAALTAIAADNNQISSIQGLAGKENLYAVFISNNNVMDIGALADSMGVLSYLDIGNNSVSNVSILRDLSVQRVWLLMENNNISDLSFLPPLLKYQKMVFYGNPITDASFISAMENANFADFYLTYKEGLDYAAIGASAVSNSTTLVDVPSDKKAAVLKQFKEGSSWKEPVFETAEEADAEMFDYRAEIKSTVIGDQEETEGEIDG